MQDFPWLPLGFDVGGGAKCGRLIGQGVGYQVVARFRSAGCVLLLDSQELPQSPLLLRLLDRSDDVEFGERKYRAIVFAEEERPTRIGDLHLNGAMTSLDLGALLKAIRRMNQEVPNATWEDALHLPSEGECLPVTIDRDRLSRREIAVRVMTGGVGDVKLSARQIKSLTPWLTLKEVEEFLTFCGDAPKVRETTEKLRPFLLAGQPEFTRVANEYIVEFQRQPERFAAMRVRMPNAILLHGPAGTGKTYALKKLSDHLGWCTIEASLGTVGSAFLHHTSQKMRALFQDAAAKKPALLILNEVDALTSERTAISADFRIEETNELLALIENASTQGVLVAGTTNRIEAIDPAFLRKGRFDIQIKMFYPEREQVLEILTALLDERPHVAGLNLERAVDGLKGRPPSDIDWLVNEAARIAARSGKEAIDDICLFNAFGRLDKGAKR